MGKSLVIVESPAKAKTIAKFLGRNYVVKASMGHVRDLPRSQFGVDVENNFEPKYITIRGKGPVLKELRDVAKKASRVLLATDPDREGEAIAWHLAQALNIDNQNCRIEFREITKDAVKSSLKNVREIGQNLVNAQQARRVLDRLVGYQLSPLLWSKVRKGLSAGRVQSVAVRLIVEREQEIDAFVPEEYWSIIATLKTAKKEQFEAKLYSFQGEKIKITNEAAAKEVEEAVKSQIWTVESVVKRERKRNPSPPFTTSTMQQEAARKLNFTAKKTMRIAQQLYEGLELGNEGSVGLITYMRTDATRVSAEAEKEVRALIAKQFGSEYVPKVPPQYKTKKGAQEAHEAIRPTSAMRSPKAIKQFLSRDQYRLYTLIWDRFVASQMESAIMDSVRADIKVGEYQFRAQGSTIKFPGFMKLYFEGSDDSSSSDEQDRLLPQMKAKDKLKKEAVKSNQHFTQPPARFSEAMLVKTLEEKGIGRPSTYAPIIDTITKRGYVTLQDKRFFSTELGNIVVSLLKEHFPDLLDVGFTADMEQRLDEVEEGKTSWREVISNFYKNFATELENAHAVMETVEIEDEISDVPCDKCGSMMVIKMGRFGKFLACPGYPDCKNTKAILKDIGVACPDCADGQIVERRSKRGRLFYGCSNYPECKFTTWNRPTDQKCPSCGQLLAIKKQGENAVCVNKECAGGKN